MFILNTIRRQLASFEFQENFLCFINSICFDFKGPMRRTLHILAFNLSVPRRTRTSKQNVKNWLRKQHSTCTGKLPMLHIQLISRILPIQIHLKSFRFCFVCFSNRRPFLFCGKRVLCQKFSHKSQVIFVFVFSWLTSLRSPVKINMAKYQCQRLKCISIPIHIFADPEDSDKPASPRYLIRLMVHCFT